MTKTNGLIRSGCQQIYPGSHELRPVALIRLESDLAPEGYLVVASVEKSPVPLDLGLGRTPALTLELLSEAAAAFSSQVDRSKEVLAKLGHDTQSTRFPEPLGQ